MTVTAPEPPSPLGEDAGAEPGVPSPPGAAPLAGAPLVAPLSPEPGGAGGPPPPGGAGGPPDDAPPLVAVGADSPPQPAIKRHAAASRQPMARRMTRSLRRRRTKQLIMPRLALIVEKWAALAAPSGSRWTAAVRWRRSHCQQL